VAQSFRQAQLLQQFRAANGTVEDLSRAWASLDRKLEILDAEKNMSVVEIEEGAYLGYLSEIEEIIRRWAA
jgi:hypothetical protein